MVIGAVLIPGAAAPKLVSNDLVSRMKPGSVLVDIAVDQGGCFEDTRATTHADPTYAVHDSIFYCVANMPGAVPNTSTYALTNATLPYAVALADKGWQQACRDDRSLALGLNTHAGGSPTVRSARRSASRRSRWRTRLPDGDGGAPSDDGARRARPGGPHLPRPPRRRARAGGQHAVVLPARPAALPRVPAASAGSAALDDGHRGDGDRLPGAAARGRRRPPAAVARPRRRARWWRCAGFHKFAVARRARRRRPGGGRQAADRRPSGCPRRCRWPTSRRSSRRPARRAPRWRCATGRCWRCSTAPAPGSPRPSVSTSTTSTRSTAPCCCAARAPRSGWCRSARTPREAVDGLPGPRPARAGRARDARRARCSSTPAAAGCRGRAPGRCWSRPPSGPASPATSRPTRCATPSPPTCSTAAPTSGSCRSCSATPRSRPRRSTRWSPSTTCARSSPPRTRGPRVMTPPSTRACGDADAVYDAFTGVGRGAGARALPAPGRGGHRAARRQPRRAGDADRVGQVAGRGRRPRGGARRGPGQLLHRARSRRW